MFFFLVLKRRPVFQSKKNLHSKHPSKGSQTQFSCFRLLSALANPADSCFFLCRYFVATSISSLRTEWRNLRSNSLSNASSPTIFYSECIDTLAKVSDAELNSWAIYDKLLAIESSPPLLPRQWAQMIGPGFSIDRHWSRVRDAFTENYKNDILWLSTLRGTKLRDSLFNWGCISSPICASCNRRETIDHCFLYCTRVKNTWFHFSPLLTYSELTICFFLFFNFLRYLRKD